MNELSTGERDELFETLKNRFEKNIKRHAGIDWADVAARLTANPGKLWSLQAMEETGGEPDVVAYDASTGEYVFYDCSVESPTGRRSLCYDHDALEARKDNKPDNSAVEMAAELGIDLLTEAQYRELQTIGQFDTKTSSWLQTPPAIRQLGGALFADFRYNTVFVYHNGASSYYAARAFRGSLRI